ncbi:hypothetical protein PSECIP111951_02050 [Pseudoalteromonas holothuriae]|uniref:DUF3016 domain-containing protein n=1 Tax=Pseudoalteromonas holothuriae TaxID=2963714 RepID=A0A9W4W2P6_9GAMM|nr:MULTISPECIES: DUF3016 domain-containing protein [unclassified Pseudoalteromonas]CAH9054729.1 hypothetical protein PSECIP111854_01433 [Pseudoalteromonas sp. CIP111854]CAH9059321.1 hypothetical protein PSECIP111951_02050 [Pseudoalteromonas sp. CIP111951]
MKNVIVLIMGLCAACSVYAGEAKVNFKDFNEYRDVYPSNEVKGAYHKRLAKQFERHIVKLAEQLPQGYKLDVTFNDIDLAGDARFSMNDVRIVKPIYFPRLNIRYRLVNEKGEQVLKTQERELKDMSFMDRIKVGRNEALYYEKRLLNEWFDKDVLATAKI